MSLFESRQRNCNLLNANYGRPQANLENKGGELAFIEKKRGLGGAVLNKNSLEESKSLGWRWLLVG